jgi:hypothetical protein
VQKQEYAIMGVQGKKPPKKAEKSGLYEKMSLFAGKSGK